MDRLGIVESFARYGATLHNKRWSVSAIAQDGSLVMSCWDDRIRTSKGVMRYQDSLSGWAENALGSALLREHLSQAVQANLPVRLVLAHPAPPGAGRVAEYFHVRPDVVGRTVSFDGDQFVFEFVRA
jgi:hypothetical protein